MTPPPNFDAALPWEMFEIRRIIALCALMRLHSVERSVPHNHFFEKYIKASQQFCHHRSKRFAGTFASRPVDNVNWPRNGSSHNAREGSPPFSCLYQKNVQWVSGIVADPVVGICPAGWKLTTFEPLLRCLATLYTRNTFCRTPCIFLLSSVKISERLRQTSTQNIKGHFYYEN